MSWKKVLGAVLVCGVVPVATAAPVIFSFAEDRSLNTEHSYIGSDGISVVTASPYSSSGSPFIGSTVGAGLKVYTCTDDDVDCSLDDSNEHYEGYGWEIDGYGSKEAAVLDFGSMVNLISATFAYTEANDDFSLLVGGIGGTVVVDDQNPGVGLYATFNFGADVVGSQFAFLANHWTDDFKLYSVTADFVSNVPEPASLSLLGLGLMALGAIKKRK